MDALLLLIPFALVLGLAPAVVAFCRKQGLVAADDGRRVHTQPTPHGGGLVLVLVGVPALLAVIWGGWLWGELVPFRPFLTMLVVASLPVAYVGWLDDKHDMRPGLRLAVHLLAVGAGLALLPPLFDFVPLWLEKLVLLLAWGWFVNLYNFMDGADGLAASEAVAIGFGVALIVPPLAPLVAVVMGVSLGFLQVNWAPAKIFLGDVGSTWLGYVLGGLLLVALIDDTWTVVGPLATVTLVFCVDATWTLVRRMLQGHKPWVPHRTFWFQRFLALGFTHRQLVMVVLGLNAGLVALGLVGARLEWGLWTVLLGFVWVCGAFLWVRRREGVGTKRRFEGQEG